MEKINNLKELIALKVGLESISGLEGFAVNYAINKTLNRMKEDLSAAKKEEDKITKIAKAFDEEANSLVTKFADGNTRLTKNGLVPQVPPEKMGEYKKEFNKLREKHKGDLEKRAKAIEAYGKFLENTKISDFEIYGVEQKNVPKNITTEQMNGLFPIIID